MKTYQVEGTLYDFEWMKNSKEGGARASVIIETEDKFIFAKTAVNSTAGYKIEGYKNGKRSAVFTMHDTKIGNHIIDFIN